MSEGKICTSCGQYKFLYEYYKESKAPDGLKAKCKKCLYFVKRLHYQNNKEKYKQSYQDFMKKKPDYQINYYNNNKNISN